LAIHDEIANNIGEDMNSSSKARMLRFYHDDYNSDVIEVLCDSGYGLSRSNDWMWENGKWV
jgi:hypothetical protein